MNVYDDAMEAIAAAEFKAEMTERSHAVVEAGQSGYAVAPLDVVGREAAIEVCHPLTRMSGIDVMSSCPM